MSFFRPEIEQLDGYIPGEQPQAGKFIKLNTNENPYPASTAVRQAIEAAIDHGLTRYPDASAEVFRRIASGQLGVDPDWILCGNGSDEILTMLTRAFVGQGQQLRLPYPSYVLYKTLAAIQGAQSHEVRFKPDWSLEDDFAAASENLRLAFLPNPNSPSGTMISRDRVLELAAQLPCPLLVDEAYVDFAEFNCLELVAENEKIMVSRSLSKSYALAGLRFGYLVAQPQLIRQLIKVKDSYNCDALSIAGAAAALNDQDWLAEYRGKILATRLRLTDAMKNLGFEVVGSHANFVWCTNSERPVQPIYEQLKAQRVLVRYMNYPGWGDGLRVSVGTDEQIDAFLTLISKLV